MITPSPAIFHPTTTVLKHPSDTIFPTIRPDHPVFLHAGQVGHRTLWVTFVLMLIGFLGIGASSWSVPAGKRIYHSLTTLALLITTLAYFALATGSGTTWHGTTRVEHHKGDLPNTHYREFHQVYWARYINWALTFPLLLIDLSFLAGLNGATISTLVTANLVMVFSALFSALTHDKTAVWGWYTISCLAVLAIVYIVLIPGRSHASSRGASVSRFYTTISLFSLAVWAVYPVIWAITEGHKLISIDSQIVVYAVLDILLYGVFGTWLVGANSRIPEMQVNLGGFWTHGFDTEGRIRVGEDDGA